MRWVNEPGGEPGAGVLGQGRPSTLLLLPLRPRGSGPGSQEARSGGASRLESQGRSFLASAPAFLPTCGSFVISQPPPPWGSPGYHSPDWRWGNCGVSLGAGRT